MCKLFGILWLMEAGIALYLLIWLLNLFAGGDRHRQLTSMRLAGDGFESHRLHKFLRRLRRWLTTYWRLE